jgi:hypothetical protein
MFAFAAQPNITTTMSFAAAVADNPPVNAVKSTLYVAPVPTAELPPT